MKNWKLLFFSVIMFIFSITLFALPAPPATVTVTVNSSTTATVSWTAASGAAYYYVAFHPSSTVYTQYVTADPGWNGGYTSNPTTTKSISGLVPGTTYYAYVCSVDSRWAYSGYTRSASTFSSTASISAPTLTGVTNLTNGNYTVGWNSVYGATGYYLDVSLNSNFSPLYLNNVNVGNVTAYNVGSFNPSSTFYYRVRAYNSQTTSSNSSSMAVNVPPASVQDQGPSHQATDVVINPMLQWSQSPGSNIAYQVYVGTNNPPSNILNGTIISQLSYSLQNLAYNTTYYWKIVPRDSYQDAVNCPVWSFTTTDEIVLTPPAVNTGLENINTQVTIPSVTGNVSVDANVTWNPYMTLFQAPALNFGLHSPDNGLHFTGRTIYIVHNLGVVPDHAAYRIMPSTSWKLVYRDATWNATSATITIPALKADGDLEIAFPDSDGETLPVELSSFTATLTVQNMVKLAWTTQSETNHLGFNLLRNTEMNVTSAIQINVQLFSEGQHSGSVTDYTFTDREVEDQTTYYYWLESRDLNGSSIIYGPISVFVQNPGNPNQPPEIILPTALKAAFPNPSNPQTTIPYYLKEASAVQIEIFNLHGQKLHVFNTYHNQAGHYQVNWDGTDLDGNSVGTGVYMYRMTAGQYTATKKLSLVK